ncbi:30S ribosomal protein S4 [Patescibacteria group bacterium]|jgi:small subunit ribosomal protein S4|nr:30S ribosomal protein S4 [Patescibacteria group bacterium]
MIVGPRYKICRRLGGSVFEKCQTQQYALSEQKKTRQTRRRGQVSDYARQLLDKQRIRFSYGVSEAQLRRYVAEATKQENPVEALFQQLELRLDNVVFRAGFASTRRQARQLVAHGHFTVNGRKSTIPSHALTSGDVVAVRGGSRERAYFQNNAERFAAADAPTWMTTDPSALTTTLTAAPAFDPTLAAGDLSVVLEFYSR